MSYLSEPTSITDYGIVKIGDHIQVAEGVISLSQDIGPSANVTFTAVAAAVVFSNSKQVVTRVFPSSGSGISISSVTDDGPDVAFTVNNTGVLSLNAGPGITIDNTTGDITISAIGADLISVYGTTEDYVASPDDEYIGVDSSSTVQITLPAGVDGRVYTIKNERGNNFGNIVINPGSSEQIDGKGNYVIKSPYQSVSMVFRAGNWWIM